MEFSGSPWEVRLSQSLTNGKHYATGSFLSSETNMNKHYLLTFEGKKKKEKILPNKNK